MDTLTQFLKASDEFYPRHKNENFKVFLFDSFEGLPKAIKKEDKNINWNEGEFAGSIDSVKERIRKLNLNNVPEIEFIKGFYEDTLNEELLKKLKEFPPRIITIDVDYYSSTKTILDWIEPLLSSGTIIYFDDIWSFFGNPNYGQTKAINEFNNDESKGYLTNYPSLGFAGHVFYYSKPEFEFR